MITPAFAIAPTASGIPAKGGLPAGGDLFARSMMAAGADAGASVAHITTSAPASAVRQALAAPGMAMPTPDAAVVDPALAWLPAVDIAIPAPLDIPPALASFVPAADAAPAVSNRAVPTLRGSASVHVLAATLPAATRTTPVANAPLAPTQPVVFAPVAHTAPADALVASVPLVGKGVSSVAVDVAVTARPPIIDEGTTPATAPPVREKTTHPEHEAELAPQATPTPATDPSDADTLADAAVGGAFDSTSVSQPDLAFSVVNAVAPQPIAAIVVPQDGAAPMPRAAEPSARGAMTKVRSETPAVLYAGAPAAQMMNAPTARHSFDTPAGAQADAQTVMPQVPLADAIAASPATGQIGVSAMRSPDVTVTEQTNEAAMPPSDARAVRDAGPARGRGRTPTVAQPAMVPVMPQGDAAASTRPDAVARPRTDAPAAQSIDVPFARRAKPTAVGPQTEASAAQSVDTAVVYRPDAEMASRSDTLVAQQIDQSPVSAAYPAAERRTAAPVSPQVDAILAQTSDVPFTRRPDTSPVQPQDALVAQQHRATSVAVSDVTRTGRMGPTVAPAPDAVFATRIDAPAMPSMGAPAARQLDVPADIAVDLSIDGGTMQPVTRPIDGDAGGPALPLPLPLPIDTAQPALAPSIEAEPSRGGNASAPVTLATVPDADLAMSPPLDRGLSTTPRPVPSQPANAAPIPVQDQPLADPQPLDARIAPAGDVPSAEADMSARVQGVEPEARASVGTPAPSATSGDAIPARDTRGVTTTVGRAARLQPRAGLTDAAAPETVATLPRPVAMPSSPPVANAPRARGGAMRSDVAPARPAVTEAAAPVSSTVPAAVGTPNTPAAAAAITPTGTPASPPVIAAAAPVPVTGAMVVPAPAGIPAAPEGRPAFIREVPGATRQTVALRPQTAAMPQAVAGTTAPAAQVFGAAMHAAANGDERQRTEPVDPTIAGIAAPTPVGSTAPVGDTAQPTLDMRQDTWPTSMIDHIEALRDAANASDTRIRLVPDALGAINIAVRTVGDAIHIRFAADDATTRTMIEDAQPRLIAIAEERGLRIGQAIVEPAPSAQTANQQNGGQSNPNQSNASQPSATPSPNGNGQQNAAQTQAQTGQQQPRQQQQAATARQPAAPASANTLSDDTDAAATGRIA